MTFTDDNETVIKRFTFFHVTIQQGICNSLWHFAPPFLCWEKTSNCVFYRLYMCIVEHDQAIRWFTTRHLSRLDKGHFNYALAEHGGKFSCPTLSIVVQYKNLLHASFSCSANVLNIHNEHSIGSTMPCYATCYEGSTNGHYYFLWGDMG